MESFFLSQSQNCQCNSLVNLAGHAISAKKHMDNLFKKCVADRAAHPEKRYQFRLNGYDCNVLSVCKFNWAGIVFLPHSHPDFGVSVENLNDLYQVHNGLDVYQDNSIGFMTLSKNDYCLANICKFEGYYSNPLTVEYKDFDFVCSELNILTRCLRTRQNAHEKHLLAEKLKICLLDSKLLPIKYILQNYPNKEFARTYQNPGKLNSNLGPCYSDIKSQNFQKVQLELLRSLSKLAANKILLSNEINKEINKEINSDNTTNFVQEPKNEINYEFDTNSEKQLDSEVLNSTSETKKKPEDKPVEQSQSPYFGEIVEEIVNSKEMDDLENDGFIITTSFEGY